MVDNFDQGGDELDFELEPESLVCSHCYNPFDLTERTPYLLPCAHTTCKQCLKECNTRKEPFICLKDSVVVPVPIIKTLSKNPQVMRVMRDRQKQEADEFKERNLQQLQELADQAVKEGGKKEIDVRESNPKSQQSENPSSSAAKSKEQQRPNNNDIPQAEDFNPMRMASNYFPDAGSPNEEEDDRPYYQPPRMPQRPAQNKEKSTEDLIKQGSSSPISQQAKTPTKRDLSYNNVKSPNEKIVLVQPPGNFAFGSYSGDDRSPEVADRFNTGLDQSSVSGGGFGKKKKKKKKKRNMQDASYFEGESMNSASFRGTANKNQQQFQVVVNEAEEEQLPNQYQNNQEDLLEGQLNQEEDEVVEPFYDLPNESPLKENPTISTQSHQQASQHVLQESPDMAVTQQFTYELPPSSTMSGLPYVVQQQMSQKQQQEAGLVELRTIQPRTSVMQLPLLPDQQEMPQQQQAHDHTFNQLNNSQENQLADLPKASQPRGSVQVPQTQLNFQSLQNQRKSAYIPQNVNSINLTHNRVSATPAIPNFVQASPQPSKAQQMAEERRKSAVKPQFASPEMNETGGMQYEEPHVMEEEAQTQIPAPLIDSALKQGGISSLGQKRVSQMNVSSPPPVTAQEVDQIEEIKEIYQLQPHHNQQINFDNMQPAKGVPSERDDGEYSALQQRYEESNPPSRTGSAIKAIQPLNNISGAEQQLRTQNSQSSLAQQLPPRPPPVVMNQSFTSTQQTSPPFQPSFIPQQQFSQTINPKLLNMTLQQEYMMLPSALQPLTPTTPGPTYNPYSNFAIQPSIQQRLLPQPLPDICLDHPDQRIRFFCRTCTLGLCPECILPHARHDFVAANDVSANEIKSLVRQSQRICKKQAKHLKDMKQVTDGKISAITERRGQEFQRLNQVISELKMMLDERERYLQALFDNEIRDIEDRLLSDIKLINSQHQEYVEMFKDLKTLAERFNVSSEIGIVGNSSTAWQYHKKTQELINTMQLREREMYVVELQAIQQSQEYIMDENDDPNRDLRLPSLDLFLDVRKVNFDAIGKVLKYGEFAKASEDQDVQTKEVNQDDIYPPSQNEFFPQTMLPQDFKAANTAYQQFQQDQLPMPQSVNPYSSYNQRSQGYYTDNTSAVVPQSQPDFSRADSNEYQKYPIEPIIVQDENGQNMGIQVNTDEDDQHITIRIIKNPGSGPNSQRDQTQHQNNDQVYEQKYTIPPRYQQAPQANYSQNTYANQTRHLSLKNFAPILEVPSQEEITPLTTANNRQEFVTPPKTIYRETVGIQADGPVQHPAELKSRKIQTTQKFTADTFMQCDRVDFRSMTTQTPKQKPIAQQRTMDIQTEPWQPPKPRAYDFGCQADQQPKRVAEFQTQTTKKRAKELSIQTMVQRKEDLQTQTSQRSASLPPIDEKRIGKLSKTSAIELQTQTSSRQQLEFQQQTTKRLLTPPKVIYREPLKVEAFDIEIQTDKKHMRHQGLMMQPETEEQEIQTLLAGGLRPKVRHIGIQSQRRKLRQDTFELDEIYIELKESMIVQDEVKIEQSPRVSPVFKQQQSFGPVAPITQLEIPAEKQQQVVPAQKAAFAPRLSRKDSLPQSNQEFDIRQQFGSLRNIHWFKWDATEVYRLSPDTREWILRDDLRIMQKFLFFSSIVHLPNDQGCFILGGSDNEDNYSKRVQYFCKYNVFLEKPQMIHKRAFFSSLFTKLDSAIYVFGGSDANTHDLNECEKFSLFESVWRQMAPMKLARNGTSAVNFEQYRLIFVFGGNSNQQGSMSQIEKYEIDFDKWTLLDIQLKKPLHDMQVLQVSRDRVLIFGGHTDGGLASVGGSGPNREIQMIDLSMECFKAKFGHNSLHLPEDSSGGKIYFPPVFDPSTGKVSLIFGYCDHPPMLEEVDISDFAANQNFLENHNTLRQNFIESSNPDSVPLVMAEGVSIPGYNSIAQPVAQQNPLVNKAPASKHRRNYSESDDGYVNDNSSGADPRPAALQNPQLLPPKAQQTRSKSQVALMIERRQARTGKPSNLRSSSQQSK